MKKSISVSNLTLDLWLKYVGPAARAAGILEEVPARDDWHEYTAEVIDEAAADEIAHCMYCACIGSHIEDGDYTSENEARRMLYQLEVSMKYSANTAEVLALLYNALSAALNQEAAEEKAQNDNISSSTNFEEVFNNETYQQLFPRKRQYSRQCKDQRKKSFFPQNRRTGKKSVLHQRSSCGNHSFSII